MLTWSTYNNGELTKVEIIQDDELIAMYDGDDIRQLETERG